MIAKPLVAFLAAPFLASAMPPLPAHTEEGIAPNTRPDIVRVDCARTVGTAFYVSPKVLLSVAHVATDEGCEINGKPFEIVEQKGDFTVLSVKDASPTWLTVDCSGFEGGRKYTAWGFARGLYTLTTVDIRAKGEMFYGFSRLWGVFNVIPGQSGGPITPVDDPHRVVGTVNVYNAERGDSGSTALKDTSVCQS